MTRYPRRTSASTRWEPIKPSAPVTATISVMTCSLPNLFTNSRSAARRGSPSKRVEPPSRARRSRSRRPRPAARRRPRAARHPEIAESDLEGKGHGAGDEREDARAERLQRQRQEHGRAQHRVRRQLRQERPVRWAARCCSRSRPRRGSATAAAATYWSTAATRISRARVPNPPMSLVVRSSRWVRRRYQSRLTSATPMLSESGSAASSAA